jgi:putative N6-adenine-specific DNA methylase
MTDATALEKRIRRHVIGPPQLFFAATAPGIEPICAAELAACLPGVQPRPVTGGVSFQTRLDEGFRANLLLRTANRVLMRIARFEAAHFSQLEKALAAIPWELYLAKETPVAARVATRKSRLHHSGAIGQRLAAAVAERRRSAIFSPLSTPDDPVVQTIFVRVEHDRFTVSLDTSGDLLHKRGLKADVGPAPLRETLAAAILEQLGYTGDAPLLDPMCGAGTFVLEAAAHACRIPAGWYRDFAFTRWPAFRPRRWAHLRRTLAALRRPAPAPIRGFDQDPAACRRVEAALARGGLTDSVALQCRDFFDLDPAALGVTPGVAVINPPYGKRLGSVSESRALFARIVDHLERCYTGWQVALIAPPGAESLAPPQLAARRLPHGGLDLVLFTGLLDS